jgi:hypothetical protein
MVGIGAPVAAYAPGSVCGPYSPHYNLYYCDHGPSCVGGPVIEFGFGFGSWHGGFHGGRR